MLINVDPNEYHIPKGAKQGRLVEACGIIPMFAHEAYLKGAVTAQEVYDSMVESYGMGDWASPNWGTVDAKGVYKSTHAEDPDLYPLVSLEYPGAAKVYIYQYAIMAVVDPQQTIISRMD